MLWVYAFNIFVSHPKIFRFASLNSFCLAAILPVDFPIGDGPYVLLLFWRPIEDPTPDSKLTLPTHALPYLAYLFSESDDY